MPPQTAPSALTSHSEHSHPCGQSCPGVLHVPPTYASPPQFLTMANGIISHSIPLNRAFGITHHPSPSVPEPIYHSRLEGEGCCLLSLSGPSSFPSPPPFRWAQLFSLQNYSISLSTRSPCLQCWSLRQDGHKTIIFLKRSVHVPLLIRDLHCHLAAYWKQRTP